MYKTFLDSDIRRFGWTKQLPWEGDIYRGVVYIITTSTQRGENVRVLGEKITPQRERESGKKEGKRKRAERQEGVGRKLEKEGDREGRK